jgi:hypothetical protein
MMHIFGPREATLPSIQKDYVQFLGVNASTLEIDTVRKQLFAIMVEVLTCIGKFIIHAVFVMMEQARYNISIMAEVD